MYNICEIGNDFDVTCTSKQKYWIFKSHHLDASDKKTLILLSLFILSCVSFYNINILKDVFCSILKLKWKTANASQNKFDQTMII